MTNAQMIRENNNTEARQLYIAFELSAGKWKLVLSDGSKRRRKTIEARDCKELEKQIEKARKRFNLSDNGEIISCYEAGRDGFWLHRYLEAQGRTNLVVDSSSIEVNRRKRRQKTDRIDAEKLMNMLLRYAGGEKRVWSIGRVPSEEEEDLRRIGREEERLKKERNQHTNRIKALLALHGIRIGVTRRFLEQIEVIRQWNGKGLPEHIKKELQREYARYRQVQEQLKEITEEKKEQLGDKTEAMKKVGLLCQLRGIGEISSWILVMEFFGWRKFRNVKQVGGAAGLVPCAYSSGDMAKELGITKSGNRRIRRLMVEIAWYWVRYQPQSELSRWFLARFANNGKRMRRVGIVALARKLLVALWKYLEEGTVPAGARLKV